MRLSLFAVLLAVLCGCQGAGNSPLIPSVDVASYHHRRPTPTPTVTPTSTPSTKPSASPSATPVASPKPSASPTATPTAAPTQPATGSKAIADTCAQGIVNGQPLPSCVGGSFFPGGSGLYRQMISAGAQVDPNSASMVSSYFGSGAGNGSDDIIGLMWHNGVAQAQYSYGRPLYVAKVTDPAVTVNCTLYCVAPKSIVAYIPANALSEGGSDAHLSTIQPNGTLVEAWLWQAKPPYHSGQTVNVGSLAVSTVDGAAYSSYDLTPGWMSNAVTAGGMVGPAGVITLAELQAGVIQHELYGVVACTASNWYYPATQTARVCTDGRAAIPDGALLQYTMSDAAIAASNMSRESKIIATAMHDYGVRISDDGICQPCSGGGMSIQVENQAAFWSYGSGVDPYILYAQSHGWSHIVNSSVDRYTHELTDMNLPAFAQVMASGV